MKRTKLKASFLLVINLVCVEAISQETPAHYQLIVQNQHRIHLLEVDPAGYRIIAVKAQRQGMQRETVTSLVKRYEAYAGVNGGFFHGGIWDGLPAGALKINGEWIGLPTLPRAALGWTEGGNVLADRILAKGVVEIKGRKYPIQKINVPMTKSKYVLFTPSFWQTPSLPVNMSESVFDHNQLVQNSQNGFNRIPAQGWAYRFTSSEGVDFPLGEPGKYEIEVFPQLDKSRQSKIKWQAFEYIVGGTPLLIKDYQQITQYQVEKVKETFLTQPHARTAVCIKPNGHWVFLVAEHTPEKELPFTHISQGFTMAELSQFMHTLNCKDAINLDGGGSSALVINNKMINAMQLGDEESFLDLHYERPVSDAILIIPR